MLLDQTKKIILKHWYPYRTATNNYSYIMLTPVFFQHKFLNVFLLQMSRFLMRIPIKENADN